MCSGSEEGSYLRLIDLCITQLYGCLVPGVRGRVQGLGFRDVDIGFIGVGVRDVWCRG